AVVGSRRAAIYGRRMARFLATSAAYAGWKVISGLAYGIDAEAHQATLDGGGVTVAVLGGGLARIHPQDHVPLARAICDHGGALVSEYPMTFPVSRQSFPRRNRIISGLSQAVVVVEAGLNSGAMLTANIALEQGRTVFAVPGQADNPQAHGCHHLIRNGARLTESFDDVLEEFEFLPGMARVREAGSDAYDVREDGEQIKSIPFEGLDDGEQMIVRSLEHGEKSLDQLSDSTGLQPGRLLALMIKLEFRKLVKQLPGRLFRLSR
ncbi:MAG: DNA-processing protein DprA, partial [Victivallales bacterium]|nr:DNA-processing protein DprA [Victivallales bacterium]